MKLNSPVSLSPRNKTNWIPEKIRSTIFDCTNEEFPIVGVSSQLYIYLWQNGSSIIMREYDTRRVKKIQ
jgi:hypothetical protein